LLEHAIKQLALQNQVMVAAAGNDGANAEPAYPAAWPGVIAVTAVDGRLNVYREANRGDYVELAAPGVDIWAARAGAGGAYYRGTSFAAPYVTAAMAAGQRRGNSSRSGDRQRLRQQARDLGEPGKDPVFGFGLLQTEGACI
jgi:subtilisin family serine protease